MKQVRHVIVHNYTYTWLDVTLAILLYTPSHAHFLFSPTLNAAQSLPWAPEHEGHQIYGKQCRLEVHSEERLVIRHVLE